MDLDDAGASIMFVLRDRDRYFHQGFDAVFTAADIRITRTGIRMPRMNPIMRRWIGTCRRELIDRTPIWNLSHLRNGLTLKQQVALIPPWRGRAFGRGRPLRQDRHAAARRLASSRTGSAPVGSTSSCSTATSPPPEAGLGANRVILADIRPVPGSSSRSTSIRAAGPGFVPLGRPSAAVTTCAQVSDGGS